MTEGRALLQRLTSTEHSAGLHTQSVNRKTKFFQGDFFFYDRSCNVYTLMTYWTWTSVLHDGILCIYIYIYVYFKIKSDNRGSWNRLTCHVKSAMRPGVPDIWRCLWLGYSCGDPSTAAGHHLYYVAASCNRNSTKYNINISILIKCIYLNIHCN